MSGCRLFLQSCRRHCKQSVSHLCFALLPCSAVLAIGNVSPRSGNRGHASGSHSSRLVARLYASGRESKQHCDLNETSLAIEAAALVGRHIPIPFLSWLGGCEAALPCLSLCFPRLQGMQEVHVAWIQYPSAGRRELHKSGDPAARRHSIRVSGGLCSKQASLHPLWEPDPSYISYSICMLS